MEEQTGGSDASAEARGAELPGIDDAIGVPVHGRHHDIDAAAPGRKLQRVAHVVADDLAHAHRVQGRVAEVGFDWPDAAGPRAKIDEELQELDAESDPKRRAALC